MHSSKSCSGFFCGFQPSHNWKISSHTFKILQKFSKKEVKTLKSLLWLLVGFELHCLCKVRHSAYSFFYQRTLFAFGMSRNFNVLVWLILCHLYAWHSSQFVQAYKVGQKYLFICLFYEHYLINHVGNIPNNAFIRGMHCLKWSLQNLSPQGFGFIHTELND